jgi:hypothetical protein
MERIKKSKLKRLIETKLRQQLLKENTNITSMISTNVIIGLTQPRVNLLGKAAFNFANGTSNLVNMLANYDPHFYKPDQASDLARLMDETYTANQTGTTGQMGELLSGYVALQTGYLGAVSFQNVNFLINQGGFPALTNIAGKGPDQFKGTDTYLSKNQQPFCNVNVTGSPTSGFTLDLAAAGTFCSVKASMSQLSGYRLKKQPTSLDATGQSDAASIILIMWLKHNFVDTKSNAIKSTILQVSSSLTGLAAAQAEASIVDKIDDIRAAITGIENYSDISQSVSNNTAISSNQEATPSPVGNSGYSGLKKVVNKVLKLLNITEVKIAFDAINIAYFATGTWDDIFSRQFTNHKPLFLVDGKSEDTNPSSIITISPNSAPNSEYNVAGGSSLASSSYGTKLAAVISSNTTIALDNKILSKYLFNIGKETDKTAVSYAPDVTATIAGVGNNNRSFLTNFYAIASRALESYNDPNGLSGKKAGILGEIELEIQHVDTMIKAYEEKMKRLPYVQDRATTLRGYLKLVDEEGNQTNLLDPDIDKRQRIPIPSGSFKTKDFTDPLDLQTYVPKLRGAEDYDANFDGAFSDPYKKNPFLAPGRQTVTTGEGEAATTTEYQINAPDRPYTGTDEGKAQFEADKAAIIDNLEKPIEKLKGEIESLETEIGQLVNDIETLESSISALQNDESNKEGLEAEKAEKEAEKEEKEAEKAEKEAEKSEKEEELALDDNQVKRDKVYKQIVWNDSTRHQQDIDDDIVKRVAGLDAHVINQALSFADEFPEIKDDEGNVTERDAEAFDAIADDLNGMLTLYGINQESIDFAKQYKLKLQKLKATLEDPSFDTAIANIGTSDLLSHFIESVQEQTMRTIIRGVYGLGKPNDPNKLPNEPNDPARLSNPNNPDTTTRTTNPIRSLEPGEEEGETTELTSPDVLVYSIVSKIIPDINLPDGQETPNSYGSLSNVIPEIRQEIVDLANIVKAAFDTSNNATLDSAHEYLQKFFKITLPTHIVVSKDTLTGSNSTPAQKTKAEHFLVILIGELKAHFNILLLTCVLLQVVTYQQFTDSSSGYNYLYERFVSSSKFSVDNLIREVEKRLAAIKKVIISLYEFQKVQINLPSSGDMQNSIDVDSLGDIFNNENYFNLEKPSYKNLNTQRNNSNVDFIERENLQEAISRHLKKLIKGKRK